VAPVEKGAPPQIPEPRRRQLVSHKLRKIAVALEGFLSSYEQYPDQAKGQLSWRVALLPFLGERPLYEKFHLNEPWDSPHNLGLLQLIPDVYQSVEKPGDGKTNFLLVTGPGTAWPNRAGLTEGRCPDGLVNTVILIEASEHLMKPWTQPEDYVFRRETAQEDLFSLRRDCCMVLMGATKDCRLLPADITDANLLAVLSPAGREGVAARAVTKELVIEPDGQLIAALERNPLKRFPPPPAVKPKEDNVAAKEGPKEGPKPPAKVDEPPPPPDLRLPVPDDKALATASATAKELYRAGYESAKRPAEKRLFAKGLLEQAGKLTSDPPGRFVLLRDARDIGAQAGAIDIALSAADKLGEIYRVDPLPMKLKVLEQAAPALATAAEAGTLFTKSLELEAELVARDDYEGARRALTLALSAARRSGNREVVNQVTDRRERLEELKTAFERVAGAMHTLVVSPDDPAASAVVGKYLCLVRQNWPRGLQLLARGNDEVLREIAQADLKNPTDTGEQTALADRWWDWAEKLGQDHLHSLARRSARLRAAHWYKQALPGLPANLASEKVKQRIAEAERRTQS
jgi:hypothetical protein